MDKSLQIFLIVTVIYCIDPSNFVLTHLILRVNNFPIIPENNQGINKFKIRTTVLKHQNMFQIDMQSIIVNHLTN